MLLYCKYHCEYFCIISIIFVLRSLVVQRNHMRSHLTTDFVCNQHTAAVLPPRLPGGQSQRLISYFPRVAVLFSSLSSRCTLSRTCRMQTGVPVRLWSPSPSSAQGHGVASLQFFRRHPRFKSNIFLPRSRVFD